MNTLDKLIGLELKQQTVTIDGVSIIVKEMNAKEGTEYEQSLYKLQGKKIVYDVANAKKKLIALTCYSEDGKLLVDPKDYNKVDLLPNRVAAKLFTVATDLNNLNKSGSIDVESAEKN